MLGKCFDSLALITHHGSRGVGAELYKRGKKFAERQTRRIANVPDHQAWIIADSYEGKEYWKALQIVREWTKLNHFGIHDEILKALGKPIVDRWWNEHNFVFQEEPDGLFYHAKGATPVYDEYYKDGKGVALIPLNMAEGVLVVDTSPMSINKTNHKALGFAPHGAGRNISRTTHMKKLEGIHGSISPEMQNTIINQETDKVDVRFWTGRPDLSELPSAYKNADKIIAEIKENSLANIAYQVKPLGSIMAGNCHRFL
jgi:RNA-splicing ligase RtcB